MDSSRYPKQCYEMLKNLDAVGRENWASHIRALSLRYGLGYVWIAQDVGNPNYFIKVFSQRVSDCYRQNWFKDINTLSKALHYKEFKSALTLKCHIYSERCSQIFDVHAIS